MLVQSDELVKLKTSCGSTFLDIEVFQKFFAKFGGRRVPTEGSDNKLILIFSKHDFSSAYLVVHVASII